MTTSEVLHLCLVIIGICSLFIQAKKEVTAGKLLPRAAITSLNHRG